MPPKAAKSKSPKRGAKKHGTKAQQALLAAAAANASPDHAPIDPKDRYLGPRPDQELLRVMHESAMNMKYSGRPADVEELYDLLWEGGKNGAPIEDVNQRNYHGFTPLAVAAAAGDAEAVALLLERGADVTIPTVGKSEIPFHFAVRYGHLLVVQQLLDRTKRAGLVDYPNQEGFTAVQMACVNGHIDVLKFLLRSKADPSSRNMLRGGVTPLHAAVAEGNYDLAELLLEYGATVHAGDQQDRGPIYMAAQRCDPVGVSLMLRWKADASKRDPGGTRALDLVPKDHEHTEHVLNMLHAYERIESWNMDAASGGCPTRRRGDARFDVRAGGAEELL
eukprot:TRINITY_DN80653_c0_g1_i1.p1 TRINITY_DN80653_c0_g1~~TRINITY_DN80653_c0_g1_i1.p1  ORF type:complete len:335 (+),score=80.44 TRINITY_DN80653_c0_g1_i1:68-1072(+)